MIEPESGKISCKKNPFIHPSIKKEQTKGLMTVPNKPGTIISANKETPVYFCDWASLSVDGTSDGA
ncbi:hypothetical protein PJIAN_3362 [Paludibacter jiangxiensis]|uniref:Uncharacterized protein n=1 Tax=Paludibacter jiangxiensis TaxID=681398 RepID=A0A170ZVL8_9BACT|nr:hypothetical protein PJIAN_3362 [Paludibacter jiangxiensis]